MAGLRAGAAHNTFPTMSGHWIPPGLFERSPWWINLFENPTTVQFVHRWLAKLLVLGVLVMAWRARGAEAVLAAAMALIQLSLGIATILTGVEVIIATLHQAGASMGSQRRAQWAIQPAPRLIRAHGQNWHVDFLLG